VVADLAELSRVHGPSAPARARGGAACPPQPRPGPEAEAPSVTSPYTPAQPMTIGLDPFRALRPRDWQRGSTTLLTWRTPGADSNDTAVIGHIDADITVWSNGKALVASGPASSERVPMTGELIGMLPTRARDRRAVTRVRSCHLRVAAAATGWRHGTAGASFSALRRTCRRTATARERCTGDSPASSRRSIASTSGNAWSMTA
jgi:hypothetical protein